MRSPAVSCQHSRRRLLKTASSSGMATSLDCTEYLLLQQRNPLPQKFKKIKRSSPQIPLARTILYPTDPTDPADQSGKRTATKRRRSPLT